MDHAWRLPWRAHTGHSGVLQLIDSNTDEMNSSVSLKSNLIFEDAATKSKGLRRELVQKTVYQLYKYEHENGSLYNNPVEVLHKAQNDWNSLTSGLSPEEHFDFEAAKQTLEQYERVYNIFEYSSELNDCV